MVRSLVALILALSAAAALAQHRRQPPLPVPPAPPLASPWQDAPVPDPDIVPPAGGSARVEAAPGLIEAPDPWRGDTFRAGATPAEHEDRLFAPAPGFVLRVPVR